ncbi:MAG: hypothetical protein EB027_07055 [Actinobacteria bacterium]|nr:hypothetical protein [Actinomycetota bacterium]
MLADPVNQNFLQTLQQFQQGGAGEGAGALNDTSFLAGVNAGLTRPLFNAFTYGMHHIFQIAAGATVVALVLLFFLPNITLRGRGAGDAPAAGH